MNITKLPSKSPPRFKKKRWKTTALKAFILEELERTASIAQIAKLAGVKVPRIYQVTQLMGGIESLRNRKQGKMKVLIRKKVVMDLSADEIEERIMGVG